MSELLTVCKEKIQTLSTKCRRLLPAVSSRSLALLAASLCIGLVLLATISQFSTRHHKSKRVSWYSSLTNEGISNRDVLFVSNDKSPTASKKWTDYELEDFPADKTDHLRSEEDDAWMHNSVLVSNEDMEAQQRGPPLPPVKAPPLPPNPAAQNFAPHPEVHHTDSDLLTKEIMAFGIPTIMYDAFSKSVDSRPAIVYFHGGGWVGGVAELDEGLPLIREFGAVVFSVKYRLAPANIFPIAFEDCFWVVKYVMSHAEEYNIDPTRVSLMGGSAGGNLAAAISYALTQPPASENFPPLRAQILISPMLQALDFRTPSYQANNSDVSQIAREDMIKFWSLYANGYDFDLREAMTINEHVPEAVGSYYGQTTLNHVVVPKELHAQGYTSPTYKHSNVPVWNNAKKVLLDPRYAPLMADQFRGLPPTFLYAGVKDVARDDALMYKAQLDRAGIKVELMLDDKGYHGAFWSPENRGIVYKKIADFIF